MKRILLSVFAAAITAAWALPTNAADVTFGGQYRLRGELRDNADFNKNAHDDNDLWGQRVRLTANVKAADDTTVKITLQDTRFWGATTATAGGPGLTSDTGHEGNLDVHEGYVNVENLFGAPVTLRAGRQELVYGDERLIGSFGWSNFGRSFDAIKATVTTEPVNVDLFWSKISDKTVTNAAGSSSNLTTLSSGTGTGKDMNLYGVYATIKAIPNNSLDLYTLALYDADQTGTAFGFGSTLGNTPIVGTINKTQTLYTYGARLKGSVVGLDYTLELPFQKGTVKTLSNNYKISAWAGAAKVGYTLPTPVKVRVGAEYDIASGDRDGTNTKIKTFFNLFPTNHDKLGLMDQQAWRNVRAANLNVTVDAMEKLRIFASLWNFKLDKKQDAWYGAGTWNNAATGIRAANASNTSSNIGNEIDVVATYSYSKALTAELGYGRFLAGKFVKNAVEATAGAQKTNQDWAYLMLTSNF